MENEEKKKVETGRRVRNCRVSHGRQKKEIVSRNGGLIIPHAIDRSSST
jgi:hypothetical protein